VLLLGQLGERDELDVLFGCATDLRPAVARQLDSSTSIVTNDVASDVRFSLNSCHVKSVLCTIVDVVAPDIRHTARSSIISGQGDSVFVHFDDEVVKNKRRVVN
jgi:hypothetical protein